MTEMYICAGPLTEGVLVGASSPKAMIAGFAKRYQRETDQLTVRRELVAGAADMMQAGLIERAQKLDADVLSA